MNSIFNQPASNMNSLSNLLGGGGGSPAGADLSSNNSSNHNINNNNNNNSMTSDSQQVDSIEANKGYTFEEQFKQLYELSDDPKRKEFLDDLFQFMADRNQPVNRIPIMAKQVLDLYELYNLVVERGGLVEVINKKIWREITKGLHLPSSITSAAFTLRTQYMKYLYPYECAKRNFSRQEELQQAIDGNRREGRRSGAAGLANYNYLIGEGGIVMPGSGGVVGPGGQQNLVGGNPSGNHHNHQFYQDSMGSDREDDEEDDEADRRSIDLGHSPKRSRSAGLDRDSPPRHHLSNNGSSSANNVATALQHHLQQTAGADQQFAAALRQQLGAAFNFPGAQSLFSQLAAAAVANQTGLAALHPSAIQATLAGQQQPPASGPNNSLNMRSRTPNYATSSPTSATATPNSTNTSAMTAAAVAATTTTNSAATINNSNSNYLNSISGGNNNHNNNHQNNSNVHHHNNHVASNGTSAPAVQVGQEQMLKSQQEQFLAALMAAAAANQPPAQQQPQQISQQAQHPHQQQQHQQQLHQLHQQPAPSLPQALLNATTPQQQLPPTSAGPASSLQDQQQQQATRAALSMMASNAMLIPASNAPDAMALAQSAQALGIKGAFVILLL